MKNKKVKTYDLLKGNRIENLLDKEFEKKQCFNCFLDIMQEILGSIDMEELEKAS